MLPEISAKRTWHHALAEGRPSEAVSLWLIWEFGRRWSRWRPLGPLAQDMAHGALTFCRSQDLDPTLAQARADPVRWAAPAVAEITVHLAHDDFGRPRDWRDDPGRWYVGMEAAMKTIDERRALARSQFHDGVAAAIRDTMNIRRKVAAYELALIAQAGQRRGLSPARIAECMGRPDPSDPTGQRTRPVPLRTVYRWLAQDVGNEPLPQGVVLPFPPRAG